LTRFGLALLGAAGVLAVAVALLMLMWWQRLRAGEAARTSDPAVPAFVERAQAGDPKMTAAAARSRLPRPAETDPADAAVIALVDRLLALIESGRIGTDADRLALDAIEGQLASMGERAAQVIADRLGQGSLRGEARDRLFNVLRRLPGNAAEARLAEEARGGPQRWTRSLAMDALADRRSDRAFETLAAIARSDPELPARPLIAGPRDPDDPSTELPDEQTFTPRMKAMMALAETQDARAVAVLTEVTRSGPDESLRMQAARYLQRLREEPRAAVALRMAAASDPSAYVRLAALHALEGSSDPALPPLLARIIAGDRDAGVRTLARQIQASLQP